MIQSHTQLYREISNIMREDYMEYSVFVIQKKIKNVSWSAVNQAVRNLESCDVVRRRYKGKMLLFRWNVCPLSVLESYKEKTAQFEQFKELLLK
jgi:hypothetical protein